MHVVLDVAFARCAIFFFWALLVFLFFQFSQGYPLPFPLFFGILKRHSSCLSVLCLWAGLDPRKYPWIGLFGLCFGVLVQSTSHLAFWRFGFGPESVIHDTTQYGEDMKGS